eukprot:SAG31_NODE_2144_length_6341_cov_59.535085_5_plen_496_part_00
MKYCTAVLKEETAPAAGRRRPPPAAAGPARRLVIKPSLRLVIKPSAAQMADELPPPSAADAHAAAPTAGAPGGGAEAPTAAVTAAGAAGEQPAAQQTAAEEAATTEAATTESAEAHTALPNPALEARLYKEAIQLHPDQLNRLIEQLSAYVRSQPQGDGAGAAAGAPLAGAADTVAPVAAGHAAASIWPTMPTTQVPAPSAASAGALPEPVRTVSGAQVEDVMYIPNKHVGIVIGKGGEMIRQLQDRSQARIQVQPDRERDITSDVRRITYTGFPAQCDEAKRLIQEVLQMAETDGANTATAIAAHLAPPGSIEKVIVIPNDAVGMVIGKSGATIQQLQMQSGTRIQLQKDAETPVGATERRVTITGDSARIEYAVQLIMAKVAENATGGTAAGVGTMGLAGVGSTAVYAQQQQAAVAAQYQQYQLYQQQQQQQQYQVYQTASGLYGAASAASGAYAAQQYQQSTVAQQYQQSTAAQQAALYAQQAAAYGMSNVS